MPWTVALVTAVLAVVAGVGAPRALAIEPSGTFIQVPGTAPIYRVLGGAAIHVDSCAPLGGCPGIVDVANLDGYASTPANGSFLRYADGPNYGWIGEFVGGSPIHIDSCAPLNGCPGTVNIDSGGANTYLSAHPTPTNGSFMRYADGPNYGWIGEFVGGSPIHVDSCAPLNGCPGTVNIDSGGANDYLSAHPTPANGAFVLVADGADAGEISRAAGGALIRVTDCVALGGCGGYVTLDAGGFEDYATAHPIPADGTLLLGLPSATTWEILAGERVAVAPSAAAVAVNDASLSAIPIAPTRSSGTGAERLRTPRRQRYVRVKITLSWRWDLDRTQLVSIELGRIQRGMKIRIRCTGRGCPRGALAANARRARSALQALDGLIYDAGDRLLIVITAPGRTPERARVVFRYGRIPRTALVR
jgi:hypothetical protein